MSEIEYESLPAFTVCSNVVYFHHSVSNIRELVICTNNDNALHRTDMDETSADTGVKDVAARATTAIW